MSCKGKIGEGDILHSGKPFPPQSPKSLVIIAEPGMSIIVRRLTAARS
jgi:hypothetical protein